MRFCRRLRSDSIGRGAVAAHDRRRAVRSAVDPLRKLLHLKETQRIVATRHVNVGYVEIDGPLLDEEAGDQRDDLAGLIIEIPSFDDWKRVNNASPSTFDSPLTARREGLMSVDRF